MRFSSIRTRGFGPFKDEVSIDFESIDATLIAVCGANGAGKSTLLELLAGSLYRETPTRGRLSALAVDRNALLETTVVNGARHTLRHLVDPIADKGESVVLDEHGAAVTASAKITEFKAWAAEHLPAPELLYSSVFAAQGSAGFLEMKPGERKGLLLKALGIERLEAMAERARERLRAAKSELAVAVTRFEDERQRLASEGASAESIAARESELDAARAALADAEVRLASVRSDAEAARGRNAAAAATNAQRGELVERIERARGQVADRDERLRNNMALLDRSREIRAAAARLAEIEDALGGAEVRADRAQAELQEASAALRIVTGNIALHATRTEQARADLARIDTTLQQAAEVAAAIEQLPAARAAVTDATARVEQTETALAKLREQRALGAEARVDVLRGALGAVSTTQTLAAAHALAGATLKADDRVVAEAAALPGYLSAATNELGLAKSLLTKVTSQATALEAKAQRAGDLDAARAERSRVEALLADLAERERALTQKRDRASLAAEACSTRALQAANDLAALRTERDALKTDAGRLSKLEDAQRRVEDLNAERTELARELGGLEERLASLPSAGAVDVPDTSPAERAVTDAREQVTRADVAMRLERERLAAAAAGAAKLAELEKARTLAEIEVADWTRLAEDLGRDGLQALEIDAAGPELTAMVNDLLHTCVSPRWTVTIETQRNSADGKKVIEGCEVRVLDTVAGREGAVETFSGGERVMIGEAVSLALSMLACRRSGVQGATIIRDESGAALDSHNAAAYVGMLRRAAQLTGASKVLFVAHQPDLWELADARIHVANGKVAVL